MSRTVQQQIDIGNASGVYAANELENGERHGGSLDERLPILLFAVTQGLQWLYDLSPTNSDLTPIGNYLISISKHSAKAEANIVGGGAIPIINGTTPPAPLDWIVSASSIPLATGAVSATLSAFIGYNINFVRGGITQYTTNPGDGSTYYSWSSSTGLFTLINGAAAVDEQMRIFI